MDVLRRAARDTWSVFAATWKSIGITLLLPLIGSVSGFYFLGYEDAIAELRMLAMYMFGPLAVVATIVFLWNLWLTPYRMTFEKLEEIKKKIQPQTNPSPATRPSLAPKLVTIYWENDKSWNTNNLTTTCNDIVEWMQEEEGLEITFEGYGKSWRIEHVGNQQRVLLKEEIELGRLTPDMPEDFWIKIFEVTKTYHMKLTEDILEYAETHGNGKELAPPEIPGYSTVKVNYHIKFCGKSGLLDISAAPGKKRRYIIRGLTQKGREYLHRNSEP